MAEGARSRSWTVSVAIASFALAIAVSPTAGAASFPRVTAPVGKVKAIRVHGPPGRRARGRRVIAIRYQNPAALGAAKSRAERQLQARIRAHATAQLRPSIAVFGGLNRPGLSATNATPSDSTGAAGPNYYVEIVNQVVGVYSKSSLALISSASLDTLTSGAAGSNYCDPQIQWDQQWQRWIFAALYCQSVSVGNRLAVGWSKTSDPTDIVNGWCRFTIGTGSILEDYPKLGHDDNHLVIGTNGFDASVNRLNPPFATAHIYAAGKPSSPGSCPSPTFTELTNATSLNPLLTLAGNPAFTPVPVNTTDSSAVDYVVAADQNEVSGAGSQLMLWQVGGSAGSPVLAAEGDLTVSSFGVPPNVPQPGTSNVLDTMDGRLTQAVGHVDPAVGAEAVWTQHTIAGGSGSVVHWYELVPTAASPVRQQGTVSDSANFDFNGAISPATNGTSAAIFYNVGSSSQMVDIRGRSRTANTVLGSLGSEYTLGSSSDSDTDFSCLSPNGPPCRWGDYAGASPDPSNIDLIWGTEMLNGPSQAANAPQWTTRNFAVSALEAAFTGAASPIPTGQALSLDAGPSVPGTSAPITSYGWDFGDGSTATGISTSHAWAHAGTYTITLTVTDSNGDSARTSAPVIITDRPPAAAYAVSTSSPLTAQSVTFDGSASSDPDGSIAGYAWSFGDGATATGATPAHAWSRAGTYAVTLTITDDSGSTASSSQVVTVGDRAPTVVFAGTPRSPRTGQTVRFNAGSSFDPDGSIQRLQWSFGDGKSGSGTTPSHAFARAGRYRVTVTATDNSGSTASTAAIITISPKLATARVSAQRARSVVARGLHAVLGGEGTARIRVLRRNPNGRFVQLLAVKRTLRPDRSITLNLRLPRGSVKPGGWLRLGLTVSNRGFPNSGLLRIIRILP